MCRMAEPKSNQDVLYPAFSMWLVTVGEIAHPQSLSDLRLAWGTYTRKRHPHAPGFENQQCFHLGETEGYRKPSTEAVV